MIFWGTFRATFGMAVKLAFTPVTPFFPKKEGSIFLEGNPRQIAQPKKKKD